MDLYFSADKARKASVKHFRGEPSVKRMRKKAQTILDDFMVAYRDTTHRERGHPDAQLHLLRFADGKFEMLVVDEDKFLECDLAYTFTLFPTDRDTVFYRIETGRYVPVSLDKGGRANATAA